ncbi:MAG: GNAT family N-acetyltransferase [Clostridia bacterium]
MQDKISKLKELHKLVFKDGDNYIEFFFDKRFTPEYCWIHEEDGQPVGAVYAKSVPLRLGTKELTVPFVTGVATHPDYRGKKIASTLMKKALAYFQEKELPFSLLHPFNVDFYRKLDYEAINFASEIIIRYLPAAEVTCQEVTTASLPLLTTLYNNTTNKLFAAALRTSTHIEDIWQEHSKDGGTGYIIFKNGIPNGYILCGEGEVFESTCEDNSILFAVKEIDGYKFKELFGNQPYSMAAAGDIAALLTSIPLAEGAKGEWVFAIEGVNYSLQVISSPDGQSIATCNKTSSPPDFHITKRQLISVALGGGERYAEGISKLFLSLFPKYEIFIYDRF